MRRGDVYLVDFDPARGSEANKTRPAILLTNDGANRRAERLGRGVLCAVPVTSNVKRVYPFQVFIPAAESGMEYDSKAQVELLRAVDLERVYNRIGQINAELLSQVDDAVRVHLGL